MRNNNESEDMTILEPHNDALFEVGDIYVGKSLDNEAPTIVIIQDIKHTLEHMTTTLFYAIHCKTLAPPRMGAAMQVFRTMVAEGLVVESKLSAKTTAYEPVKGHILVKQEVFADYTVWWVSGPMAFIIGDTSDKEFDMISNCTDGKEYADLCERIYANYKKRNLKKALVDDLGNGLDDTIRNILKDSI
jgi:hypothetical protein